MACQAYKYGVAPGDRLLAVNSAPLVAGVAEHDLTQLLDATPRPIHLMIRRRVRHHPNYRSLTKHSNTPTSQFKLPIGDTIRRHSDTHKDGAALAATQPQPTQHRRSQSYDHSMPAAAEPQGQHRYSGRVHGSFGEVNSPMPVATTTGRVVANATQAAIGSVVRSTLATQLGDQARRKRLTEHALMTRVPSGSRNDSYQEWSKESSL